MDIREAKRSDWPTIEDLVKRSFHPDYGTTSEVMLGIEGIEGKLRSLREEFDASGSRFIAAFEGPRAIGAILARQPQPGRIWIEDIFVAPDARKKGIATELIAAATPPEAEAICEVNLKNEAALRTFEKLGFTRVTETAVFRREPQA